MPDGWLIWSVPFSIVGLMLGLLDRNYAHVVRKWRR
mgnify:CR=1 FL=1